MVSNPLRKRKLDELLDSFKLKNDVNTGTRSTPASTIGHLHLPFSSMSTNIFLGNLNPVVTEDMLCALFGKYGPIASVKIMWPRTKEELSRGHHSGFVCYMDRPAAQRAYTAMQGQNIQGFPMRLDWGKPVTLPSKPGYVSEEWKASTDILSASGHIVVEIPDDPLVRALIHQTIERVLQWGRVFEEIILTKNADNPTFQFLFDTHHPYNHYYQWKMYSLMQGDSTDRWRTIPFRMIDNGPLWTPPPCIAALDDEDPMLVSVPDDSDSDLTDVNGKSASLALVRRLRALCRKTLHPDKGAPTRAVIARIMALAIIASEAAADVSRELTQLLIRGGPEWQVKMLYVVHEILINSTAPVTNAWRYRDTFTKELPVMFECLGQTYLSLRRECVDKWAADAWRNKVLAVVSSWRAGIIFPRSFISELESLLKPVVPVAVEVNQPLGSDQASVLLDTSYGAVESTADSTLLPKSAGSAVNWVPLASAGEPVVNHKDLVCTVPSSEPSVKPKTLAFNLSKPIARRS